MRIGRRDFNDWVNGILGIYSDSTMVNEMLVIQRYTQQILQEISSCHMDFGGFKPSNVNTDIETVGVKSPGGLASLDSHG